MTTDGPLTQPLTQLVALETGVWEALTNGDMDADRDLLSDDFLGVYPSGFSDRTSHVAQLVNGPTVVSYQIHDARVVELSSTAALLSYRAVYARAGAASGQPETMYVSSIWEQRDERWVNVFSQDTPAAS